MARKPDADAVYRAADSFRQRTLVEGRSFLWPAEPVWTLQYLDALWAAFMEHPDTSSRSFLAKWHDQLSKEPDAVHRIASDLLAFYYLFPSRTSPERKLGRLREVISWKLAIDPPDLSALQEAYSQWIGYPGAHYNTGQNWQIAFYLGVFRRLLQQRVDPFDAPAVQRIADDVRREISEGKEARHILLHLMFPDRYERSASERHKRTIVETLRSLAGDSTDLDEALASIRRALESQLGKTIDFYETPEVRRQWDPEGAEEDGQEAPSPLGPRCWVEKTIVRGRTDRESGEYALGQALWSPKHDKRGGDIYRFMREVKVGDFILHLTDNSAFTGISRVAKEAAEFRGVPNTEWGEGTSYLVNLGDFVRIEPELSREAFFASPHRERLLELLDASHKNLFYNRGPALNQGAYLTPAPLELVRILDEAYESTAGKRLTDLVPDLETLLERVPPAGRRKWIFQANPRYYDIRESVKALPEQTWSVSQYRKEINPGDKVYLWESGSEGGVLAIAEVLDPPAERSIPASELPFFRDGDFLKRDQFRVTLRITRILPEPLTRTRIADHPVLANLSILRRPQGTNYPVTDSEDAALESLIGHTGDTVEVRNPEYTLEQCALDTGLEEATLRRWIAALERKGQAIIYGPPGTGKTYVAERLARHIVGGGDGVSEIVQFHPAYAYEDFVLGIRPRARANGGLDFPTVPGRFLEFCKTAEQRQGRSTLIIDEINRANLAKVLGEIMYLMEYRDQAIPLAAGVPFRIPPNVRIIGTMNTADRSIALVDHALRRRFAFIALYPNYEILKRYHAKTHFAVDGLIETLQALNEEIGNPHYHVGVTFFLRPDLDASIEDIWRMEIDPYLEEFFFDQPDKARRFEWAQVKNRILKSEHSQ